MFFCAPYISNVRPCQTSTTKFFQNSQLFLRKASSKMFDSIFNTGFQSSINVYQKICTGNEDQRYQEKKSLWQYDLLILKVSVRTLCDTLS